MNTSTVVENGKGATRPPVVNTVKIPAGKPQRIIFVTRRGLAVVGYTDSAGKAVRS